MSSAKRLVLRASTTDITPLAPVPLFGRAKRSSPVNRVVSRLEANCLLLLQGGAPSSALVTIDSLYSSNKLRSAVLDAARQGGLNLDPASLLIVASHTHTAPALDDTKPNLGCVDEKYFGFVVDRISECLLGLHRGAGADIERVAAGQALCQSSVFRRREVLGLDTNRHRFERRTIMAPNPRVHIDQQLKALALLDSRDQPVAVLWSWPCHAVSQAPSNEIGADFPGVVRQHIRSEFESSSLPVFYFPGFSGDIRPYSRRLAPVHFKPSWMGFGPRFGRASQARADRLNAALVNSFTIAWQQLGNAIDITGATPSLRYRQLSVAELRTRAEDIAPLECHDWSIGQIRIKAASAEIASGYSDQVGGNDPLTFVTGCAGQVFGYIPTDEQLPHGGYEVDGFAPLFSIPGMFHDRIEAEVLRLLGT